jgi:hypothetical protein
LRVAAGAKGKIDFTRLSVLKIIKSILPCFSRKLINRSMGVIFLDIDTTICSK